MGKLKNETKEELQEREENGLISEYEKSNMEITLKLNELIADWFMNNEVMSLGDYDKLMLESEN